MSNIDCNCTEKKYGKLGCTNNGLMDQCTLVRVSIDVVSPKKYPVCHSYCSIKEQEAVDELQLTDKELLVMIRNRRSEGK